MLHYRVKLALQVFAPCVICDCEEGNDYQVFLGSVCLYCVCRLALVCFDAGKILGRLNVHSLKKMEEVTFKFMFISASTIKPSPHTLLYPPSGFLVISIFHKSAHAVPTISGLQSAASSTYSFLWGQQNCTDTTPNHCLCLCAQERE